METVRTVVCKLAPTPEQRADIDATLVAFAAACDFAAETARSIGSTNKVKVQQACYREIREPFGLSANLAIRAIARACAALKVPAKMHSAFAPTSIDYDARIFSFIEWNWTFGLTLLSGRVKIATASATGSERRSKGREPTSAVLVKRRDGGYFLHVQLTDEAPRADRDQADARRGHGRQEPRHHGRRRELLRRGRGRLPSQIRPEAQDLPADGHQERQEETPEARKKEARFRANENHVISKRIVEKAKGTACAIAIEDLEGIGERTTAGKPTDPA